jgi:hypothetical protein
MMVLVAAAALPACASSAGSSTSSAAKAAFLVHMRAVYPPSQAIPDAQLINVGEATCALFRAGKTFDQVTAATAALQPPPPAEFAGALIANAVPDLCPHYRSALPQ